MPPNENCPNCQQKAEDWHVEWYKTEGAALYRGLAAMDCPICRQALALSMRATGLRKKSEGQTPTSKQRNRGHEMSILTPQEKSFLDVFLHEVTTSPFTGPATKALHESAVEFGDILHIAWAYNQEVPRTSVEWGHAAAVAPPLAWTNREAALRRNLEIQRIWEHQPTPVGTPKAS